MPDESRSFSMRMGVSSIAGAWMALMAVTPAQVWSQAARVTRAEVIGAEDARGKGPSGIQPLVDGLEVPSLRQLSIRAIGRLEQPYLIAHIIPFLDDPGLSATTADAIAQSMQGLKAESMEKSERALVDSVLQLLRDRATAEQDWSSKGVIARSIGRLPYDGKQAREAESALISLAALDAERPEAQPTLEGIAHGLYTLARSRRETGDLSPAAIEWLRRAATYRAGSKADVQVRRPAWLALNAAGGADRHTVEAAVSDPDAQVRRLAVAALPNVEDPAFLRERLGRAARDPDAMVRLEWVRVYRQLAAATDCKPLLAAMADTVHHVRLAAIDALGGPCPEGDTVIAALRRAIDSGPASVSRRTARGVSWHARAHALTALARIEPETARELLRRDSRHPVWQVRMYVARGATVIKDSVLLTSLALDEVGSVREVAIQGLSSTLGHLPDLAYVRALSSKDYPVVLAAARALRGTRVRDSVVPGLLDALERITREQRQTSRDPRIELLARLRELADSQVVPRLQPLLTDMDEVVALEAASVMNQLTKSTRFAIRPKSVASAAPPPVSAVRVRVTMSPATGGGAFDVLLDAERAPMTVARVSGVDPEQVLRRTHVASRGSELRGPGRKPGHERIRRRRNVPARRTEPRAPRPLHARRLDARPRHGRCAVVHQPRRQLSPRPRLHGLRVGRLPGSTWSTGSSRGTSWRR